VQSGGARLKEMPPAHRHCEITVNSSIPLQLTVMLQRERWRSSHATMAAMACSDDDGLLCGRFPPSLTCFIRSYLSHLTKKSNLPGYTHALPTWRGSSYHHLGEVIRCVLFLLLHASQARLARELICAYVRALSGRVE
jgi:hypothetical protein